MNLDLSTIHEEYLGNNWWLFAYCDDGRITFMEAHCNIMNCQKTKGWQLEHVPDTWFYPKHYDELKQTFICDILKCERCGNEFPNNIKK